MREAAFVWFEPSVAPMQGELLLFDYGAGPVAGVYRDGRFASLDAPACGWPPECINRWRYCSSPDGFGRAAAQIAA